MKVADDVIDVKFITDMDNETTFDIFCIPLGLGSREYSPLEIRTSEENPEKNEAGDFDCALLSFFFSFCSESKE